MPSANSQGHTDQTPAPDNWRQGALIPVDSGALAVRSYRAAFLRGPRRSEARAWGSATFRAGGRRRRGAATSGRGTRSGRGAGRRNSGRILAARICLTRRRNGSLGGIGTSTGAIAITASTALREQHLSPSWQLTVVVRRHRLKIRGSEHGSDHHSRQQRGSQHSTYSCNLQQMRKERANYQ